MPSWKEYQALIANMSPERKLQAQKERPELFKYSYEEAQRLYNNMSAERKAALDYDDLEYGGYTEVITSAPQAALGGLQSASGGLIQAAGDYLNMPQTAQYGAETYQAGQKRAQEAIQAGNFEPGSGPELAASVAPEAAVQIPLIAGAVAAPTFGVPALLGMMAARTGGQKYGSEREKGSTPERAAVTSTVYGIAEFAGEALGAKYLSSLLKTPAGKNIIKGALKYMAEEMGSELGTEALQSGVDYLSKKTGGTLTPDEEDYGKRMLDTIKQTAVLAPILGGTGVGVNLIKQGRNRMDQTTPTAPPTETTQTVPEPTEQEIAAQVQQMYSAPQTVQPTTVDQAVQEPPILTPEQQQSPEFQQMADKVNAELGLGNVAPIQSNPAVTPDFIKTTLDMMKPNIEPQAPLVEEKKPETNLVPDFIKTTLAQQKEPIKVETPIVKETIKPEPVVAKSAPTEINDSIDAISNSNVPIAKQAELIQEIVKLNKVEQAKEPTTQPMVTPEPSITSKIEPQSTIAPEVIKPIAETEIVEPGIENKPDESKRFIDFAKKAYGNEIPQEQIFTTIYNIVKHGLEKKKPDPIFYSKKGTVGKGKNKRNISPREFLMENETYKGTLDADGFPTNKTYEQIKEKTNPLEQALYIVGNYTPEELQGSNIGEALRIYKRDSGTTRSVILPYLYNDFKKSQEVLPNDQENKQGVPSEIGIEQEPIQARPVEEAGREAVSGSSYFQEPKEEIIVGKTPEEKKALRHDARNKLQAYAMIMPDESAIKDFAKKQNIEPTEQAIDDFTQKQINIVEKNLDDVETSAVLPNLKKTVEKTKARIKPFVPKVGMSAKPQTQTETTTEQPSKPKPPAAKLNAEKMTYVTDITDDLAEVEKQTGIKIEVKARDMKNGVRGRVIFDNPKKPTKATIYLDRSLVKDKNAKEVTQVAAHEFGHVVVAMSDHINEQTLRRGNALGVGAKLIKFLRNNISVDPETTDAAIKAAEEIPDTEPYASRKRSKAFMKVLKDSGQEITNKKMFVKEALDLWAEWEGENLDDLSPEFKKYLANGQEIYATLINVLMNNPALLHQEKYNTINSTLKDYMENKASGLEAILREHAERILRRKAGLQGHINEQKVKNQYIEGESKLVEAEKANKLKPLGVIDQIITQFASKTWIGQKLGRKVANALQNIVYADSKVQGFLMENFPNLQAQLVKLGVNYEDLGQYLELVRTDGEYRAKEKMARFEWNQAKNQLAYMRKNEPERAKRLEQARQEFIKAIRPMKDLLIESGMFTDELNNAIDSNDYYATFKFFYDGESQKPISSNAGFMGDMKSVKGHIEGNKINPVTATLMTFISSVRNSITNNAKKTLGEALVKDGQATVVEPSWNDKEWVAEKEDGKQLILWRENGEVKGVSADPRFAEFFEPSKENSLAALMNINQFYRAIYTSKNPGFWSYAVIKDFLSSFLRMPGTVKNLPSFVGHYVKTLYGAATQSKSYQEGLKKGLQKGEIIGSMSDIFGDDYADVVDERNMLNRVLQKYGITAPEAVAAQKDASKAWKFLSALNGGLESIAKGLESSAKISMRNYLEEVAPQYDLKEEDINYMVRNWASQNFKERGQATGAINHLLLFFNPFVQGIRSDAEAFNENKAGYTSKLLLLSSTPLLLLAAMASQDDYWKKLLAKIPEYDLTNYMVVPLGEDENGKPKYLRFPLNEMTKLVHGLMYKAFLKPVIQGDTPRDWSGSMADILGFAYGQVPQFTPIFEVAAVNGYTIANKPVWDPFRERFYIPKKKVEAGIDFSYPELIKYNLENFTGGWISSPRKEENEKISTLENIMNAPVIKQTLGRFFKVSDQGVENTKYVTEKANLRDRARTTLTLEMLWNKKRDNTITPMERKQLEDLKRIRNPKTKQLDNKQYLELLDTKAKKAAKK